MKSAKRHKKGHISEEDMSNLLHRYPAQKVLALLQEVSQSADAKMDWNALVQRTATGITNAREYQMLWRHIAYCEELNEKVDDGAEPLDDDSDLEYELEAYPAVSAEASAEAAACVKVLIGPGDSKVPNSSTVEAPLTINIPNGQSSKSSLENSLPASMQGTNITVPVSVQKLPISQGSVQKQSVPIGATGDGSDVANTNLPSRRKRKPWSEEEDQELIAAVRKCGEGNWANILKGDFKGDRTASQLSQRWTIIRRRKSNQSGGTQSTGPQVSDTHVDTNRALHVALCDSMPTVGNGVATTSKAGMSNTSNKDNAAVNNNPSKPQNPQFTPPGGNPVSSKPGTLPSLPNPRPPLKKAPLKPLLNQDSSMVTKVAVAAGARIASPSEATLFKAAQANNAIHIMPKGGSTLMKPSVTSTSNPTPSSTPLGPNRTMPFGSPPVRPNLVRPTTSPSPTPSVPISHPTTSIQTVRSTFMRPTVLPPPTAKASTSSTLPLNKSTPVSQPPQASTASRPNEVEVKKEEKTSVMMKVLPPPLPLTRPLPSQTIGAQQKPSPASSSVGLVAPIQSTARVKENSQCLVNTEKGKAGIVNSKVSAVERNSVDNLKNKNEALAEGKRGEASSEKQSLPISKVVSSGKPEAKSESAVGAEKSEQKEQYFIPNKKEHLQDLQVFYARAESPHPWKQWYSLALLHEMLAQRLVLVKPVFVLYLFHFCFHSSALSSLGFNFNFRLAFRFFGYTRVCYFLCRLNILELLLEVIKIAVSLSELSTKK
ncbi:hypothetical protein V2J09_011723 [Rumex salicifolius]